MAVELLIRRHDTGTSELVPVATSDVFHKYWGKGSEKLNLHHVLLFEDAVEDFARAEIPVIIEELRSLSRWFEETQSPEDARTLVGRVNNVILAFQRVLNDSNLSIG